MSSLNSKQSTVVKPRRSALYMPAINTRAMQKAQNLNADVIIFDLEDAVAPDQKAAARDTLEQQLTDSDYGARELLIRVNAANTIWFEDDIKLLARVNLIANANAVIAGVVLPKVESAGNINGLLLALDKVGIEGARLGLWPMIETPRGVLAANEIMASSSAIEGVIMGTSDLAKDLYLPASLNREGLQFSLAQCLLAARANGIDILDGVCLDLVDETSLLAESQQGRLLGFNGKSLIHPKHLAITNREFGIDKKQLDDAQEVIKAWQLAVQEGSGVVVVNGRLVESLHVEAAQRLTALAEAIAQRGF